MAADGTKRTFRDGLTMSALGGKADLTNRNSVDRKLLLGTCFWPGSRPDLCKLHPLPVLGQSNEAARVHHASRCRDWDLAVGKTAIPTTIR